MAPPVGTETEERAGRLVDEAMFKGCLKSTNKDYEALLLLPWM